MRVIAFDLDDTLLRWQGPVREAVVRTAAAASPTVDPAVFAAAINQVWYGRAEDIWRGRLGLDQITRETAAAIATALRVPEAEAARLYDRYLQHFDDLIVPYEDAPALRSLSGSYRLGVATNGIGDVQRGKLRRAGLADLFAFVVVSADLGVAKPDPAFYEFVREAAGVPAHDVVVVGNNVARDLLPAVAVGMRAIWVQRADDAPQEVSWDGPAVTSLYALESVLQQFG